MKNKLYYFFLTFSLIALTASCSKDDDSGDKNSGGSEPVESFITLTMTGDQTGEFSSDAMFSVGGNPETGYDLMIQRGPEDIIENTTFQINFQARYLEHPLPIATGSYDLVHPDDITHGDGNFTLLAFINKITMNHYPDETLSGTLNITESNNDYIAGDFSFSATSSEGDDFEVNVEGEFLAKKLF